MATVRNIDNTLGVGTTSNSFKGEDTEFEDKRPRPDLMGNSVALHVIERKRSQSSSGMELLRKGGSEEVGMPNGVCMLLLFVK